MEKQILNKNVEKILKKKEIVNKEIFRELKEKERIEKAIDIVLDEKTNFNIWFYGISGIWLVGVLVLVIVFNNAEKLNNINTFGVMISLVLGMLISLGVVRVYFRNKCEKILKEESI